MRAEQLNERGNSVGGGDGHLGVVVAGRHVGDGLGGLVAAARLDAPVLDADDGDEALDAPLVADSVPALKFAGQLAEGPSRCRPHARHVVAARWAPFDEGNFACRTPSPPSASTVVLVLVTADRQVFDEALDGTLGEGVGGVVARAQRTVPPTERRFAAEQCATTEMASEARYDRSGRPTQLSRSWPSPDESRREQRRGRSRAVASRFSARRGTSSSPPALDATGVRRKGHGHGHRALKASLDTQDNRARSRASRVTAHACNTVSMSAEFVQTCRVALPSSARTTRCRRSRPPCVRVQLVGSHGARAGGVVDDDGIGCCRLAEHTSLATK